MLLGSAPGAQRREPWDSPGGGVRSAGASLQPGTGARSWRAAPGPGEARGLWGPSEAGQAAPSVPTLNKQLLLGRPAGSQLLPLGPERPRGPSPCLGPDQRRWAGAVGAGPGGQAG